MLQKDILVSKAGCQFATPSIPSLHKKGKEDLSLFYYKAAVIHGYSEAPGFHVLNIFVFQFGVVLKEAMVKGDSSSTVLHLVLDGSHHCDDPK